MAIRFFNIRSGEEAVAESEPHISAMWASSDHSPNITQGQDFGWRMAPEVVVKMKEIKQDVMMLQQIAVRIGKPLEDVGEPDILSFISSQIDAANAPIARTEDYTDMYDQEVRRLTAEQLEAKKKAANETIGSTDTKESLEDLERRVQLEERLAAARATAAAPVETTTTTTEAEPTTTTTTTKAVRSTTTTTEAK